MNDTKSDSMWYNYFNKKVEMKYNLEYRNKKWLILLRK
jgi:hypothetical protein